MTRHPSRKMMRQVPGASFREICSTLESEGRRTKRGGIRWQPMAVKRVLDRMGNAA